MISDLIYLNSIVASELMKITENLAAIRHGEEFLKGSNCIPEHNALSQEIVNIVNRYNMDEPNLKRREGLEKHILKHQ